MPPHDRDDPHRQLDEAGEALPAAPGPFVVEKAEGFPGRMILRAEGGIVAEVILSSVIWGSDR